MNKLILFFLLLGVLGFSKGKVVIREKKYLRTKKIFIKTFRTNTIYKTETENLVDYNYICVFNN